jgi:hypothetical protein
MEHWCRSEWAAGPLSAADRFFTMLSYLPAKRLVRYLSARTATAIKLPGYPEPDPTPGSR